MGAVTMAQVMPDTAAAAAAAIPATAASVSSLFNAAAATHVAKATPITAAASASYSEWNVACARARKAILSSRRIKLLLDKTFRSLNVNLLTEYQKPRVEALLEEANQINSVQLNSNRNNIYDMMRIFRSCSRQV